MNCFYSEWVLGNREDLVKDIIAELQPENGEVMLYKFIVFFSSVICFVLLLSSELMDICFLLYNDVEHNILKQIVRSLVRYTSFVFLELLSMYWISYDSTMCLPVHKVQPMLLFCITTPKKTIWFTKRFNQCYHIPHNHPPKNKL